MQPAISHIDMTIMSARQMNGELRAGESEAAEMMWSAADGWVMALRLRTVRVQKALCHDTSIPADSAVHVEGTSLVFVAVRLLLRGAYRSQETGRSK